MTVTGYSDRVDHALAFAAKHHYQQAWKGSRAPYGTSGPNTAIILTRYAQDEETVVCGILHEVVQDFVREGYTREMLEQRIAAKFGVAVLDTLVAVTERRHDDDGVEMTADERRRDRLERLTGASPRARWVFAAAAVHDGSALLTDLRRTEYPEVVWSRFSAGREGTLLLYRQLADRLSELGFDAPILAELVRVVDALEETNAVRR
ncbi:MAG TPA: HD domain-containing protein [Gemmatimonadaceae bacterium]|nr:HD domain-containing protein [Gemmatimonadaceae bacterium]